MPSISSTTLLAQRNGLCALAWALTREDAEDLVQDAYVVALSNPRTPRSPGPWMRQVLRNSVRNKARQGQRRRELHGLVNSPRGPELPEDAVADEEVSRMLREAMAAVGSPYCEVIQQRFFEDRSAAEIARDLDISAGTVRWRLHEGISRMRHELDQRSDEHSEGGRAWTGLLLGFAGPPPDLPQAIAATGSRRALGMWAIAGFGVATVSTLLTLGASSKPPLAPRADAPAAKTEVAQTRPTETPYAGAVVPPRPVDPARAPTSSNPSDQTPTSKTSSEEKDPLQAARECAQHATDAYNATPDGTGDQAMEYLVEAANCAEDAHMIGQSIQLNLALRRRFPNSTHAKDAEQATRRLFSRILDADQGLDTVWGQDCVAPLADERSEPELEAAAQCLTDAGLFGAALRIRRELSEKQESRPRQTNLEAVEALENNLARYRELQVEYLTAD